MTRSEFDKSYGDRLIGLLVRAWGDLKAIADSRSQGVEHRLLDAGRLGEAFSQLVRDGYALRDEIWKQLVPDPVAPEPKPDPKPAANGQPQQPAKKV